MYPFFFQIGRTCLYCAVILLGHDLLSYLEDDVYTPMTLSKLWNLLKTGHDIGHMYTTGSTFWDQFFGWPAFIVFAGVGGVFYVLFKNKA